MVKENRGGKRKGAGRKPKPPTVTITFRVKPDEKEPIRQIVRAELKKLRNQNK
jgi:hypothetical protein